MNVYGILDVGVPSALFVFASWIFLFFVIGAIIIIISVFVIRAELKVVKKKTEEAATVMDTGSTEGNGAGTANVEKADANDAKE